MKREKRGLGYFKNIFFTMLFATLTTLLLALIAFQLEFSRATTQYLSAINEKFVKNAAENIQYKITTATAFAQACYSTYYGTTLIAAKEPSPYNLMQAIHTLDYVATQNSTTYSIYFVNGATQHVSCFGAYLAYISMEDFRHILGDGALLDMIETQPQIEPFVHRQSLPYGAESDIDVYTFVFQITSSLRQKNTIVLNLSLKELFGVLTTEDTSYSEAQNNFIVYDKNDTLLFQNVSQQPLLDAGLPKLGEIIDSNGWEKAYSQQIGGKSYLFLPYKAANGMRYVNIVDKSHLAKSFSYNPIFITAVLAAIDLLGIGLIWAGSLRLYTPIRRMSRKLKLNPALSVEKSLSEIEFISRGIDAAWQKMDRLFEYKEKTLSLAQADFLRNQLMSNQYSAQEFWDNSKAYEVPYQAGDRFLLIHVRWAKAVDDDARLTRFAIDNVVHELLEPILAIRSITLSEGESLFVCTCGEENAPDPLPLLNIARDTFLQHFQIGLCFYLSPWVADPELLAETYSTLSAVASDGYFHADGCVRTAADVAALSRKTELCAMPDFDALEIALRNGNIETSAHLIDAFFAQLPAYTCEAAIASVSLLSARLVSCFKRLEAQLSTSFDIDYYSLYSQIAHAHQLNAAQALVHDHIELICNYNNSSNDDALLTLAGKIVDSIDITYADFNLTSKMIATQHHISVSTLNRIFKRQTGDSVANYIKKLRLTKARELLMNTNLAVEAIALEVGFENTKYFYTLYKTEYGVSPAQHRAARTL